MQIIHTFTMYFANPLCGPDATGRHPEAPRRRKRNCLRELPFARFAKKVLPAAAGSTFSEITALIPMWVPGGAEKRKC